VLAVFKVHPVPPPNSEIIERIKKRYETKRIKIEKLLTLGYRHMNGKCCDPKFF